MNLTPVEFRMLALLGEQGKTFSLADANEIFNGMIALRGATFVSIIAATEPKMRKTGNPYVGVAHKVAVVNGQVNFDYDHAVENARVKEGSDPDDWTKGQSWHEPVLADGRFTPFCRHKKDGTYYLRIRRQSGSSTIIDRNTGQDIGEAVKPFLQVSSRDNQGLSKPVEFLTYGLSSIKAATFGGKTFVVR